MFISLLRIWKKERNKYLYFLLLSFILLSMWESLFNSVMPGLILKWIDENKIIPMISVIIISTICSYLTNLLRKKWKKEVFLFRLHEIGKIQNICISLNPRIIERDEGKERIESVMQSVASGNDYGIEAFLSSGIQFITGIIQIVCFLVVLVALPRKMLILTIVFLLFLIPYELKYQKGQVNLTIQRLNCKRRLEEFRRCILSEQYLKDVRMRSGINFTELTLARLMSPVIECIILRKKKRVQRSFFSLLIMLFNLLILLFIWINRDNLIAGEFIIYMGIVISIYNSISKVLEDFCTMSENKLSCKSYLKFIEMEEKNKLNICCNKDKQNDPVIQFVNVSFNYGERKIFENLNFEIKRGERIAIVGENGVGKTTLIKLILKVLEESDGAITVCGDDKYNVYNHFSACMQESPLLPSTIAENISCAKKCLIDRKKLFEVAHKAGITDFIKRDELYNVKYSASYYSDGVDFSGGERQKINIGRVMYKDSNILLLDEPTASLDAKSELEIYKMYDKLAEDKTCLFVSHRLNTTSFCDRIIFIESPQNIEIECFSVLYQRNKKFKEMYDTQMLHYKN